MPTNMTVWYIKASGRRPFVSPAVITLTLFTHSPFTKSFSSAQNLGPFRLFQVALFCQQFSIMGFDCGFDIFPRLDADNEADTCAYREFLDEIVSTYESAYVKDGRREDGKVLQLPDHSGDFQLFSSKEYIQFMVGECPRMPASPVRCDYFLRFSSKVSGGITACAEPYIKGVYRIAKKHLGDRVRWWHEMNQMAEDPRKWRGYYDWSEVHEADRKLRALEAEQEKGWESGNDQDEQQGEPAT